MALLSERDQAVLRQHFADLADPVQLLLFTGDACEYCDDTRTLLRELAALAPERILLQVVDRAEAPALAEQYGIDKVPAIVILKDGAEPRDTGIRFFGIPSGYEFATLIDDIQMVSSGEHGLAPATLAWLAELDRPLHLQVFVTPTCPYCPRAVMLAHRLALASPQVRADMVEAMEFPELADRYQVYGVPRTVVNETIAIEGAVPEAQLVKHLKRAAAPARAG